MYGGFRAVIVISGTFEARAVRFFCRDFPPLFGVTVPAIFCKRIKRKKIKFRIETSNVITFLIVVKSYKIFIGVVFATDFGKKNLLLELV